MLMRLGRSTIQPVADFLQCCQVTFCCLFNQHVRQCIQSTIDAFSATRSILIDSSEPGKRMIDCFSSGFDEGPKVAVSTSSRDLHE